MSGYSWRDVQSYGSDWNFGDILKRLSSRDAIKTVVGSCRVVGHGITPRDP